MYIQEVVEQEVTESSTNRQHTLSFLLSLGAAMMELLAMYIQEVVVVEEEDLHRILCASVICPTTRQ